MSQPSVITFNELFPDNKIPITLVTFNKFENDLYWYTVDLSGNTLLKRYGKKLGGFLKIDSLNNDLPMPSVPWYQYRFSIDLSNNELEEVNVHPYFNIECLNLKNNHISKIFIDDSYTKITNIDLSNNRLDQFPETPHVGCLKELLPIRRLDLIIKKIRETCNDSSYKIGLSITGLFGLCAKVAANSAHYYFRLAGDKIACYEKLALHSGELRNFMNSSSTFLYSRHPLAELYIDYGIFFDRLKWGLGLTGLVLFGAIAYNIWGEVKDKYWMLNYNTRSILRNTGNFTSLNLGNNRIKQVPRYIKYFTNLRFLNLAGNNIEHLPYELTRLTNIQELNLLDNPLGQHRYKGFLKKNIVPCGSIKDACIQPVPWFSFLDMFGCCIKKQKQKHSYELYQYISKLRNEKKIIDTRQINLVNHNGIFLGYINTSSLESDDPARHLRAIAAKIPYSIIQHINSYIYNKK